MFSMGFVDMNTILIYIVQPRFTVLIYFWLSMFSSPNRLNHINVREEVEREKSLVRKFFRIFVLQVPVENIVIYMECSVGRGENFIFRFWGV